MPTSPRIALIHATALAMAPVQAAFERNWPAATRMNLLDDRLSVDRAEAGALTPALTQRFADLALYARGTGCTGILFTCSAFGPAIEAAGAASGLPTLKPNEAMFDDALAAATPGKTLRLALIATFEPSLAAMAEELNALARQRAVPIDLRTVFVPEAMHNLAQGRVEDHHRKIAEAARAVVTCDRVMLAQFSMADARPKAQATVPCKVLTSPDSAVLALRRRMGAAE